MFQLKIHKILTHLFEKDQVILIQLEKIKNNIISQRKIKYKVTLIIYNHQVINIIFRKNINNYLKNIKPILKSFKIQIIIFKSIKIQVNY